MKEKLINLGFEKWLSEQELAPYTVMFWDTPKFIQLAYVQKFLREHCKISVSIFSYDSRTKSKNHHVLIINENLDFDNQDLITFDDLDYDNFEEALEAGILKAIEDDK